MSRVGITDKLRRIEHVVTTQGGNASMSLQDAQYGPLCWYDEAHAIEQERDALKAALTKMVDIFKDVPRTEQVSPEDAPEPFSQWDNDAFDVLYEARALIGEQK